MIHMTSLQCDFLCSKLANVMHVARIAVKGEAYQVQLSASELLQVVTLGMQLIAITVH